ncbi:helix-turn-helix domain-containing protein [Muricauda sp. MAR_2010_75]|jgi:AraC-like DNA-binding protein|uniref:AraC family transcriptional regulator n=1 Tax=Allomuricauda sp. MAR_2010_75 TaxID=1250232 RepID=UPI00055E4DBD|nr:helix-turn-helix domain-containing protein [Muricauda sp. MAR_2010_75]
MDTGIILLGIFSGIAVATSFYFASYFLFVKKKDRFKNSLLGFLFIAIGFRIAKSIAYFIFIDVISAGLAMGYLGLSSIGPLVFLYIRSFGKKGEGSKSDFVHFIVPFLGVIACFLTHLGHIVILYKSVTALLFVYLAIAFIMHFRTDYHNKGVRKWNLQVLVGVCVIGLSFVTQHLTPDVLKYAIGTGVASLVIYYLFISALKSQVVFTKPVSKKLPQSVVEKIKNAFEKDKIYMEQALTLSEFSKNQEVPTYLVSEAIKKLYGKRFPEAINYFRIEEIKKILINNGSIKIEALAYEVGFNTPSTFYAAFKRETNMSPKEFQKKHLVHY